MSIGQLNKVKMRGCLIYQEYELTSEKSRRGS